MNIQLNHYIYNLLNSKDEIAFYEYIVRVISQIRIFLALNKFLKIMN